MKEKELVLDLGGSIKKGEIESYTGKSVSILNPKVDQFCLVDIAKGLGYEGHFGGQTPYYFSIAQHCLLTEFLYVRDTMNVDPVMRMVALMHDCAEAYMSDILKPFKIFMPIYTAFEKKMEKIIFKAFNLPFYMIKEIKPFDLMAQQVEKNCFRIGYDPNPMTPDEGVQAFMDKFNEIQKEINKLNR